MIEKLAIIFLCFTRCKVSFNEIRILFKLFAWLRLLALEDLLVELLLLAIP